MTAQLWRVVVVGTSGHQAYFDEFERAVTAGWPEAAVRLPASGDDPDYGLAPVAAFSEVGGTVAAVTARVQDILDGTGAGFITAILVRSMSGGATPCRQVWA